MKIPRNNIRNIPRDLGILSSCYNKAGVGPKARIRL